MAQLVMVEKFDCVGWFIVCLILAAGLLGAWARTCRMRADEVRFFSRLLIIGLGVLVVIGLIANPINFLAATYAPKAVAVKLALGAVRK